MNILIAGCGYAGIRIAEQMHNHGHTIFGLRRSSQNPALFIQWIRGDMTKHRISNPMPPIDLLILAAGLRRDSEKNYNALFIDGYSWLINHLKAESPALKRIVMVSTTSVFAECGGGWIDEASLVNPDKSPAKYYLEAEDIVAQSDIAFSIVRLSGIYGPGRIRFIRAVKDGTAQRQGPPPQYINHIHVDDAAGAVVHVAQLVDPDPIYVASDQDPSDRDEVLQWISDQLGLGPVSVAGDKERLFPRGGNKRCRSKLLVESGFTFRYPSFREGYTNLLD